MGKKHEFKKKSITIISTALLFGAMGPQAFAASTFNDISNSYAKDAILQLAEKGIVNGVSSGQFDPRGVILRQDFAIILAKALNLDVSKPPSIPTFSDVPAGNYAYKYVEAAARAGLINGRGGGFFGEGTTLSRQDMAVIFVRALGVDTTGYAAKLTFSDNDAISEYAKDAVGYAVTARLIQGIGDNTFNPKGVANRQDVASVASKFLMVQVELAKSEPSPEPTPNPTPTPIPVPTPSPVSTTSPVSTPNPEPVPVKNHAPVASVIEAKSIKIEQHVNVLNVSRVFTDRDGDSLTFSASSSNSNVATVSLDGNDLYVSGISVGSCTITLTANDGRGGVTTTTFDLNVTLSSQQLAINKIDSIIKNVDASGITLNDINSALSGKLVSILEENLDVYRVAISNAEDLELNSSDKIAAMVTDVNATLDKEITTGITVGGAILKYHLLIDPMEFNVASASKVISFATTMDDPFTNSNIYSIMKKTAGYDSKYFFNIPTSKPLNLKSEKGDHQVLFIYVDQDKKSVGYSVHNNITVTDNNHIPVINNTWAAPSFSVGTDKPMDLTGLFTDEDENDTLTYSIEALDPDVADVTSGEATAQPTIHPVAAGNAQFKITVSDGHGGTNETTISVTINQPDGTEEEDNGTLEIKDLGLSDFLEDSIMLQYTSVQGATSEVIEQSLDEIDWVEASSLNGAISTGKVTFIDVQDLLPGQHYYFRMKVSNDITTSYSNVYEYTVPLLIP
ncbi:hypothetical protein J23TS9_53400 [Paenibacillus sp. J23TS9]|uniref:S-layer homology domain-containing protein n=1 Tax=Paenibacillus sp. J23TS9 TaxID=2807193 RepID=UPI001AFFE66D|nr:S-layer homology domain-containing protein [Paenibacillus sp. J23TS9]GIP30210.1 hypothetical protein J23TS9_53400 [Paenibacillus sp. J23TS9]